MKEFMKKHPIIAEILDMAGSILSGSFALIVIVIVWVKSLIRKRRKNG